MEIEMIVFDKPPTKGSVRKGNKGQIIPDNPRLHAWTENARYILRDKVGPEFEPVRCSVQLAITAIFARPKGDYVQRDKRPTTELRKGVPQVHIIRPDVDKVARAVCDMLSGHLYRDDSQVDELTIKKRYGLRPATHIKAIWNG